MTQIRWIETEGGPLVVLPLPLRARWGGSGGVSDEEDEDDSDYGRCDQFIGSVGVLPVDGDGGGHALVLGSPEQTAWFPARREPGAADGDTPGAQQTGGMFVRKNFADGGDDAVLRYLADIPASLWEPTPHIFCVDEGPLSAFDAALEGKSVDERETLTVPLAPGLYELATAVYRPDKETELELVRLRKK